MTEEELEKLGEAARQDHVPVMMEDGLASLLDYIRSHPRIQSILEIGTAVGYSAMNMASVRSLCDLTSGSGDKGTPVVLVQGYFDNYTN